MNCRQKIQRGNGEEIAFFREILPEQAVGVFIQTALPGTVVISKIYTSIQTALYVLVIKEFIAVIHNKGTEQGFGEYRESSGYSAC